MISLALASMLLAAQSGQAISQSRQAYADCMNRAMRAHLERKASPAVFDTAVSSSCAAQAAAYRSAVLAAETAAGSTPADAAELATLEVEDLETNTRDLYRAHLEDGTRPE